MKTTKIAIHYLIFKVRRSSSFIGLTAILALQLFPNILNAQRQDSTQLDGTDGLVFSIPGVDSASGKQKNLVPNEFANSYATFKIGLGFIEDYVAYTQSKVFKQQMDTAGFHLDPTFKPRDFRVLGSILFKTKRAISIKFAYMWDGDQNQWLIRETGLTVAVPELFGHIFIGRTKEGYSLVKVMNGHSPWTAERQMALDVIPILADGIKWFGYLPKSRLFWNLGAYTDLISKGQGFSTYKWQYDARIGWLALYDKENGKVLHLAFNLRYGKPVNNQITLKSRPESNPTPQLINTGVFSADHSSHEGFEIYYTSNRLMLGSEVMIHQFYSKSSEYHVFYGGDIVATYFLTNTHRPYNTSGSIFGFIPVTHSVFKGGWGEWEAVLRYSKLDLDNGSIQGGKFWRLTPMINWYLTKIIRMEFIYGYGVLDRYKLKGNVQFYQARIQFTL